MNCTEVRSQAYAYFEQQLDLALRAAIEAHVAACPGCAEIWAKARELTCREFVARLADEVGGELAPEAQRVLERHMSICGTCREYREQYQATIRLARAAHRPADPAQVEALEERLVARILGARRGESTGRG